MTELKLQLPDYDGPLDLLLNLVKSQEIDIYDIPIAQITDQYLAYLEQMQSNKLAVAGEYFVMAATLLKIKSTVLLPQNEFIDEDFEEDYDPRQELVEQLLQYEVFQQAANFLAEQEARTPKLVAKDPTILVEEEINPLPLGKITATELGLALQKVLQRRFVNQPQEFQITSPDLPLAEQIQKIEQLLQEKSQLSFFELLGREETYGNAISLFLALLELIAKKAVVVAQDELFEDVIIKKV